MSNRYRAKTKAGEAMWQEGEFEHEFASIAEENDALNSGHLELVPRDYLVVSDHFTIDGAPLGQNFVLKASIPMEIEEMWISQGHLQRVEDVDVPTKDELLERAKELDVPGRTKMSKEELTEAIAAAEKQDNQSASASAEPKE